MIQFIVMWLWKPLNFLVEVWIPFLFYKCVVLATGERSWIQAIYEYDIPLLMHYNMQIGIDTATNCTQEIRNRKYRTPQHSSLNVIQLFYTHFFNTKQYLHFNKSMTQVLQKWKVVSCAYGVTTIWMLAVLNSG